MNPMVPANVASPPSEAGCALVSAPMSQRDRLPLRGSGIGRRPPDKERRTVGCCSRRRLGIHRRPVWMSKRRHRRMAATLDAGRGELFGLR
jgi:hypothetical protein